MSELPPLEEPQAYVVVGPDDQRGPYTMELLIGEVLAGRLSDATPVWWPGLSDWTTMGGHPALSAEIQRRRAASATQAPAWADPTQTAAAPQPSYEQPGYGQQPVAETEPSTPEQTQQQAAFGAQATEYGQQADYGQSYGATAAGATAVEQAQQEQEAYQQAGAVAEEPAPAPSSPGETARGSGTLIDVDSTGAVAWVTDADSTTTTTDFAHRQAFEDLVARSTARGRDAARVAEAEEQLVRTAIEAVTSSGFSESGREVVDGHHEMRFAGESNSELVLTIGRFADTPVRDVANSTVPFQASLRAAPQPEAGQGESHGEIVVVSDEWSGQSTAMVSLVLGLEDYLDSDLTVDNGAVARDVRATVAMLVGSIG